MANPYGRAGKPVSDLRKMSQVEASWIGAMIEAEGTVAFPSNKRLGFKVNVTNADPEVLSALLRTTNAGSISPVLPGKLGKKVCYRWQIQALVEVKDLIRQCAPYSMKLQRLAEGVYHR
jgi:hypothetical protein